MADPSQILVVRLSSIGDVLLATPLVRVLRRAYPRARLRFLVKSAFADLVRSNPYLDGVLAWPDEPRRRGAEAAPGWGRTAGLFAPAVQTLIREVRREGPLWLVDLQASPRSRAFVRVVRPQRTFTYGKPYLRRLLLLRARLDAFPQHAESIAERYFDALRGLRLRPDGGGLDLVTGTDADARAGAVLEVRGPDGAPAGSERAWIAVAPGASWATKRWPAEAFAAAARDLAQDAGCGVVVVGSAGDRAVAAAVTDMLSAAGVPARQLAGDLSLLESAAVLRRCSVLLSNDSGAAHLAAAVGTSVVSLFGSTVPQFGFVPYGVPSRVMGVDGLPCRPCTHVGRRACPLGHFRCMRGIAPAVVAEAARGLVQR